jgi:hypothetical protein
MRVRASGWMCTHDLSVIANATIARELAGWS